MKPADATPPTLAKERNGQPADVGNRSDTAHKPRRSKRLEQKRMDRDSTIQLTTAPEVAKRGTRSRHAHTQATTRMTASVNTKPNFTSSATQATTPNLTTSGDFIVDRVVDHDYTVNGELIFRVRWYGYDSCEDTWEPIRHLRRSQVLTYLRRRRLAAPATIDEARDG